MIFYPRNGLFCNECTGVELGRNPSSPGVQHGRRLIRKRIGAANPLIWIYAALLKPLGIVAPGKVTMLKTKLDVLEPVVRQADLMSRLLNPMCNRLLSVGRAVAQ